MTSKQATTLSEYLDHVSVFRRKWTDEETADVKGEVTQLWFRGQHDSRWGLQPKFYRPQFREAVEPEIRQEFQSRAMQMIQGRFPSNKWEWYFLMQHYGAPTRLLDWTDSALVALFFAVHEHHGTGNPAVWVLDPWWLNKKLRKGVEGPMEADWSEAKPYLQDLEKAFEDPTFGPDKPAAIEPPHVDRRVAVQRSRFVIFGKTKDLTKTKAAREPQKTCRLAKIEIPLDAIRRVQAEVESAGLTISAVFPDLQGLCRELCDRWILIKRGGQQGPMKKKNWVTS